MNGQGECVRKRLRANYYINICRIFVTLIDHDLTEDLMSTKPGSDQQHVVRDSTRK